jgi:hypothetical protein
MPVASEAGKKLPLACSLEAGQIFYNLKTFIENYKI